MEECVNVYQKQREDLLSLARSIAEEAKCKATDGTTNEGRPPKRRRTHQNNVVDGESEVPMRATRSISRRALQASQESIERSVVQDSEDDGSQYAEEGFSPLLGNPPTEPDDGLVACPTCKQRMKEEAVFPHLDQCDGLDRSTIQQYDCTAKRKQSTSVAYSVSSPSKARQRLGALNYSLLTETALRKKLAEIGIPSYGSKPLMQRRHVEWMNLWNASCDSSKPMTKRELLRELDIWERTQGRQFANAQGPAGVMAKDFDADGWTKSNKDDFADLVRKAREKAHKAISNESKGEGTEKEFPPQPQNVELSPDLDHTSKRGTLVDLTSPSKPPLEQQQQSQGSQMNGVIA
jgi:E3 ubiquitin-protein ligase RAD18